MIPYQAFMKNAALRKNVFDLHMGFATFDGAHWVCPEYLNAYRDEYRWTVQD